MGAAQNRGHGPILQFTQLNPPPEILDNITRCYPYLWLDT